MTRIFLVLLSSLLITALSFAQSKKEARENKLKSITVFTSAAVDGQTVEYKESYKEFDKAGHTIVEIDFKKDGSISMKRTARYDAHGNKTEETIYEPGKEKHERRTSTYNSNNDKILEVEYDGETGEVLKRTSFSYNIKGYRTSELETDAAGNFTKKVVYTYNSKGLKVSRQVLDNNDKPKSRKNYNYLYF